MKKITFSLILVFAVQTYAQQFSKKIISVNLDKTYQTIGGFGDCSLWQPLIDTYNNFHNSNPGKLDEIADMLFTDKDPDRSFNFHYNHQVDIMACIDKTTNAYIPKSQKDNTDRYWYAQKLAERGGQISFRQSTVPNLWKQVTVGGKTYATNTDVPLFMSIMARTVKKFQKDYGFTFTGYTPMNESSSPWIPPNRPAHGSNSHLTNAETVSYIKEARKAFDTEGLTSIKLSAFDALYLNIFSRLNLMLNSDAKGLLDHLSYHEYQSNESFQETWHKRASENNLQVWQTEWGDFRNLASSEAHAQAKNYAKHIFKALSRGKVSVWLAWELKFIFNINDQGWEPKEAAWMMAQFSRFADRGMQMVQVNEMGTEAGTLAFMEPGSGERDLSYVTYNASSKPEKYVYDFNSLQNVSLKDIRLTSASDDFQQLNNTIDSRNRLYITVPAEAMLSIRVGFNGVNKAGTAISKSNWSLVSVSSQHNNNTAGEKAFDGNPNTIWHTKYDQSDAFPNHLTIDLGAEHLINGFSYLPRKDNSLNGVTADYDLYLSTDGENWGEPVSAGTFAKDHDLKKVTFYPTYGRYVKFVPKSAGNGETFSSCAELNLYEVDKPTEKPMTKFQLSKTSIRQGDSIQFKDLSTGIPTKRKWYLDKGTKTTTKSKEIFSEVYNTPGKFDVTLVVWNDHGKDSLTVEKKVTVLADTQAPKKPEGITALAVYHDAVVRWDPSKDDISSVGYKIFLDGEFKKQVNSLKYVFKNLKNNQSYSFGVAAVDEAGNVSETTTYDFKTKDYVEDKWVKVPIENYSFELPNDNKQHKLLSEIPGWSDDMEELNGAGTNIKNYATDGKKVGVLSSHLGGTMYQPLASIIVDKNTEYRLTYDIKVSYFSNPTVNLSGNFKMTLGGYDLDKEPTSRTAITSKEYNIPRSKTAMTTHTATFEIKANSSHVNQLLVLEFDLLDLVGSNWVQIDNIRLEKKINAPLRTKIFESQEVGVFPNPVVSGDYVTINGVTENARINLFNLAGNKVSTAKLKSNKLNSSNLSKGLYLLKIYDHHKTIVKKLIVN